MLHNEHFDNSYNNTFNIDLLDSNNYVYNRCSSNYKILYEKELDIKLYKEIVAHSRNYKNWIHYQESLCGYITYVYLTYNDVLYNIKINQIDELIKAFLPTDSRIIKRYKLTCNMLKINKKNYYNSKTKIK